MAAISLPPPGSELGPCAEACEHRDCSESRFIAESACISCGEPIGYERRFFYEKPGGEDYFAREGFVHAACLEAAVRR